MAKTYRLKSAEFVNAAGLLRWAQNGARSKRDLPAMMRVFDAAYAIPKPTLRKLLTGKIKHKVEGEDVIFTV